MLRNGRITKSFFSSHSSSAVHVLKIGDVLSESRKFLHRDLVDYSEITRDANPLHLDSDFARGSGFDDRVVHGMLVASLFPRIIASHFPGAVYFSQKLQFKLPVYIGEEVVAEVQAINLRESREKHIAKFSTKCFKNGDHLVIDGEAVALLPNLEMEQKPCQS